MYDFCLFVWYCINLLVQKNSKQMKRWSICFRMHLLARGNRHHNNKRGLRFDRSNRAYVCMCLCVTISIASQNGSSRGYRPNQYGLRIVTLIRFNHINTHSHICKKTLIDGFFGVANSLFIWRGVLVQNVYWKWSAIFSFIIKINNQYIKYWTCAHSMVILIPTKSFQKSINIWDKHVRMVCS